MSFDDQSTGDADAWRLAVEERQRSVYIRGDLVWTLVGDVAWPGRVDDADLSSGELLVFRYGSHSISPISRDLVVPWTDLNRLRFLVPRPSVPLFDKACVDVLKFPGAGRKWSHPLPNRFDQPAESTSEQTLMGVGQTDDQEEELSEIYTFREPHIKKP